MRIITQTIWDAESLKGVHTSTHYDVGRCYAGSIQLSWPINVSAGIIKLQASLDRSVWTDVPETECTISNQADSVLWNLGEVHYPWLRVYVDMYNTTEITSKIFMKGG